MNATPSPVRFTSAAYFLLAFAASLSAAVVCYVQDQPFGYLGALFAAVITFVLFADAASRHGKF